MPDPSSNPVPVMVPLAAIAIGALLAIMGLLKPSFFWDSGRVVAGRNAIGEGGMTMAFVALGLVLCVIGGVILARK